MFASRRRRFTLIELLVTLAVAAILLTSGLPSFRDLMNRPTTKADSFLGVLVKLVEQVYRGKSHEVMIPIYRQNNTIRRLTVVVHHYYC